MFWLRVLVVLLDLYLVATLVPYAVLLAARRLLGRKGPYLADESARFEALQALADEHARTWPATPRSGVYADADAQGQVCLRVVQQSLGHAEELRQQGYSLSESVSRARRVLLGGAWPALVAVFRQFALRRRLRRILESAEAQLRILDERREEAEHIPDRLRGALAGALEKTLRARTQYETHVHTGMLGLDEVGRALDDSVGWLNRALASLETADIAETPALIERIGASLSEIRPVIDEMEQEVAEAETVRRAALSALDRVVSASRLAAERWEGLRERGASDVTVADAVDALRRSSSRLSAIAAERTPQAYKRLLAEVARFDQAHADASATLDRMHSLFRQCADQLAAGKVQLTEAKAVSDEIMAREPLLDADESAFLIGQAEEALALSASQYTLGTAAALEQALSLAEMAMQALARAIAEARVLPDRLCEVRSLLSDLSVDTQAAWRHRADEARTVLQSFPVHWASLLSADYDDAMDLLDQTSADVAAVPPDVRLGHQFRQSELVPALQALRRARRSSERACEIITALERERDRLSEQRAALAATIGQIERDLLPALRRERERMRPEIVERLEAVELAFTQHTIAMKDPPGAIDYDQALQESIPSLMRQLQDVRAAQVADIQRHRHLWREKAVAMDRLWARLMRLEPQQPPHPDEDVDRLAAELDAWREQADRNQDDPVAIDRLLGEPASELQHRIELARGQIIEGRRALAALLRTYRRASRSVQALRSAVRTAMTQSAWPQLQWDDSEADGLWAESLSAAQEAQSANRLSRASAGLQHAVNLAQQAERSYGRLRYQMSTTLGRLDSDLSAVTSRLDKQQRIADQLRDLGDSSQLHALDALNERISAAVERARRASTIDEALLQLRAARELLDEA